MSLASSRNRWRATEPALPLIDESVVAFDVAVFDHSCSRLTCTAPLAWVVDV